MDAEQAKKEWSQLKKTVRREGFARHTVHSLFRQVVEYYPNDFPNIIKLAQCAVTLPVHTADVERSFSCQNRILTPLRGSLKPCTQDYLYLIRVHVYLEGPKTKKDLDDWIVLVVDKGSETKERKLFAKKSSSH